MAYDKLSSFVKTFLIPSLSKSFLIPSSFKTTVINNKRYRGLRLTMQIQIFVIIRKWNLNRRLDIALF